MDLFSKMCTGCPRIQKGTNLGGGKTIPDGEIVDSMGIFESFFFSSINPKTFSDSLCRRDPTDTDPRTRSKTLVPVHSIWKLHDIHDISLENKECQGYYICNNLKGILMMAEVCINQYTFYLLAMRLLQ